MDYGLLGGIGAGVQTYTKVKGEEEDRNMRIMQMKNEIEERKRLRERQGLLDQRDTENQQADRFSKGLIKTDSGFDYTPEEKRKRDIEMGLLDAKRIKELADANKARKESAGKLGLLSDGQKAVDKDYAKDYNDLTGGGITRAKDAIQKLKDLRVNLQRENKEFLGAGGGPISGSLPDFMRDEQSIAMRDNIITVANSALKATFGGQLSDGERKALANEFYNDKLSPEENLKIMDRKILELQNALEDQSSKARYYEKSGTISGYKGASDPDIDKYMEMYPEVSREQATNIIKNRKAGK